jgi:hypothetical protein
MEVSMPLHRTFITPTVSETADLKDRLVEEWRSPKQEAHEPVIEEVGEESHEHPTRLRVIWDAWKEVPEFERSVIIMEAYEEVRGVEEILYVISAEGLTFDEAKRRGVNPVSVNVTV